MCDFACRKHLQLAEVGRSRVWFPMTSLEFFIDLILPTALWPWGRLSLWQKWVPGIFPGYKGGWCLGLTTLPPSCVDCLEIWKPQPQGAYTPTQSSPVQLDSQSRGSDSVAYNGSRGSAYTPSEWSRVKSHESCRVVSLDAACSFSSVRL